MENTRPPNNIKIPITLKPSHSMICELRKTITTKILNESRNNFDKSPIILFYK
jgi:hypothetical protein